jgi:hypothetical protein
MANGKSKERKAELERQWTYPHVEILATPARIVSIRDESCIRRGATKLLDNS